jgi:GT2 family glycosyltransferase
MFSVIIPTRNRLAFLQEALRSVLEQRYPRLDIAVVDDASGDGTVAWLAALRDERVRYLVHPSPGERARARNAGARLTRGDWLVFLDDDDMLAPGALHSLARGLSRHPGAVGVAGRLRYFNAAGEFADEPWPRRPWCGDALRDTVMGPLLGVNRAALSRRAFERVGGWEHEHVPFEDYALSLRIAACGPLVLVPDVVGLHRYHDAQSDLSDFATATRRILHLVAEGLAPAQRRRVHARRQAIDALEDLVRTGERSPARAAPHALQIILGHPDLAATPLARLWLLPKLGHALLHGPPRSLARVLWRRLVFPHTSTPRSG